MGRGVRAKVKKEDKKVVLTKRELEKIKKDEFARGVDFASRVTVAIMAENHNLTEDEIFEDMEDFARYGEYKRKGYIDTKDVDEIVERRRGIKFQEF